MMIFMSVSPVFASLKEPLFWIALLTLILTYKLLRYAKRQYRENPSKTKIEILEISTLPKKVDGQGGLESDCFILIKIFNQRQFDNLFLIELRENRRSGIIEEIKKTIPASRASCVRIVLDHEKVKSYVNQKLLLIVKDVGNKKKILKFKFENTPYNNKYFC